MTLEDISRSIEKNDGIATDKNGIDPIGHHNYLVCYEKYMSPIKNNVRKVLELGIGSGASLVMWNRYFKNCHVYGIDNYHTNIDLCNKVVDRSKVDHQAAAQVGAIKFLAKYLSKDGYYFLEDIHVDYGRQPIKATLDGLGLELVEDYCDLKFLPNNYNEYHMFVIRRKR